MAAADAGDPRLPQLMNAQPQQIDGKADDKAQAAPGEKDPGVDRPILQDGG